MRWGDFVLVGATLIVCALLWGKLVVGFSGEGRTVEIVAGGSTVLRYDLATQQKIFESDTLGTVIDSFSEEKQPDGNTLLHLSTQEIHFDILLQDGKVRFLKSDCPDKVCVQTGLISKPGQIAACIPAHVLVRVTGAVQASDIDVIIK